MIRLRLASFGSDTGDLEIPIEPGQSLDAAIQSILANVPLNDREASEVFHAVVNGHIIHHDLWTFTALKESDTVLVAPQIHGGETGVIFKQVALIAITLAASYFSGGAYLALSPFQSALLVAGASIGGSLLLNALIPPPVPKGMDGGTDAGGYEESQMYSVTGQGNAVKKYGSVPKVYGRHRMFPTVAANPYTEIETDPDTKQLAQYLYVVYDFGLGPVRVEDIRIGDSPLGQFDDVFTKLVDFNRPEVDEGVWDTGVVNYLTHYKGDANTESVGVVLEGNANDNNVNKPQSTWQVIRTSAPNSDASGQSISLAFINTRGLYSYSASGVVAERTIDLNIYFAPVGTEDWIPYNDEIHVSQHRGVGGDEQFDPFPLRLLPIAPAFFADGRAVYGYFDPTPTLDPIYSEVAPRVGFTGVPFAEGQQRVYLGWSIGTQVIGIATDPKVVRGVVISHNNVSLGVVASVEPHSLAGYSRVTLEYPMKTSVHIFTALYYSYKFGYRQYPRGTYLYSSADGGIGTPAFRNVLGGQRRLGRGKISGSSTSPVYSTFTFTPRNPGQYKVKVTRISTTSEFNSQFADSLTLASLTTRFDRDPIVTDKRHTFLEVRIRATNQLSGTVSNLSAVCTSVLDVWDGTAWVKQLSNNPAWVFADLLTGTVNKRAIAKSRLHLPSLIEWADFCDEVPVAPTGQEFTAGRFESNFILDFNTTLQTLLNQVTGAAQASLNIIDGKYGVLIDKKKTIPVQVFTPRNSRDFNSTRNYVKKPDALKIQYINPEEEWTPTELVVYDDGYDEETALEFDELQSFGVTNQEQAWRFGRYMMAQNRLRQENITITVDFEYLICSRGDYVQITQDVMKVGGFPARVKSVYGSQITIDDAFESDLTLSYGYVFRGQLGNIETGSLTILNSDTFELDGPFIPGAGDLIIIGVTDKIVYDCIVKSITPADDLTATLILVEKADAVYDAESLDVFPPYDPRISTIRDSEFTAPGAITDLIIADNAYQCAGSGYEYYIDLDWSAPANSAYDVFEVYVNSGQGYSLVATTRNSLYRYIVEQTKIDITHYFKVIAVSAAGRRLNLGDIAATTATPMEKKTPPSDIEKLSIDITGEVLQLVWEKIEDCDCDQYLIRYSPNLSATWTSSVPLLRLDRNSTLASTQARTGIYFIKALDFNGNESSQAATAITTIPKLFGLNIIETIDDFPVLGGSQDRVRKVADTLILNQKIVGGFTSGEYYEEGYYYYQDLLDLGEIFSVRLQSLIEAEGYTEGDLMSNWVTLSSVNSLITAGQSDWDVKTQYRSTNVLNSMALWDPLSDVAALSEGDADDFTEWRDFIMGDATGRIFQFRLRLISNKVSVTPRVFAGTIKADMPDRVESYNNLVAPVSGYELAHTPAFWGPETTPNVQISIDNAASGDYWLFDYRNLEGFKIRFYDKTDTAVSRQFDVAVKGYGRKAIAVI